MTQTKVHIFDFSAAEFCRLPPSAAALTPATALPLGAMTSSAIKLGGPASAADDCYETEGWWVFGGTGDSILILTGRGEPRWYYTKDRRQEPLLARPLAIRLAHVGAAISPDGRYALFGRMRGMPGYRVEQGVDVFDLITGQVQCIFKGERAYRPAGWSPCGRYVFLEEMGTSLLYVVAAWSWSIVSSFEVNLGNTLFPSPTGDLLVTSTGKNPVLRDTATGKQKAMLPPPPANTSYATFAWAPGNTALAAVCSFAIHVWRLSLLTEGVLEPEIYPLGLRGFPYRRAVCLRWAGPHCLCFYYWDRDERNHQLARLDRATFDFARGAGPHFSRGIAWVPMVQKGFPYTYFTAAGNFVCIRKDVGSVIVIADLAARGAEPGPPCEERKRQRDAVKAALANSMQNRDAVSVVLTYMPCVGW